MPEKRVTIRTFELVQAAATLLAALVGALLTLWRGDVGPAMDAAAGGKLGTVAVEEAGALSGWVGHTCSSVACA